MRIDLADLDRLEGIGDALERLFWCLMALGLLTAILGSAGTGLLVLVLGAAAFVAHAGLEDFARARREQAGAGVAGTEADIDVEGAVELRSPEPAITVYRTKRQGAAST